MEMQVVDKEVDPEYASHVFALKRAEKLKEESACSIDKLKAILNEEFNKELTQRQNQVEYIEKQIYKTRKLLHLMRYVLISSYYNRKELEYDGSEDLATKADSSYLFDQNRIHPALKKLLGKNTSTPDFNMCRSARRNKKQHKTNVMVENLNDSNSKNVKTMSSKIINPNKGINTTLYSGFDRNRQKIKNRIIVGNISKWMPSYEDDNLTHKWMMYVRGPKENPDVSHFIEKVVFYLHPSYKPHDVEEVREPPFHLSRRGWGEFPIRVQIHFICGLNKPVDIVHNLKLDKTYSGRQTLGNESIIDLYLYDDHMSNVLKSEDQLEDEHLETEENGVKKHEIVDFADICEKEKLEENLSNISLSLGDSVSNFEHNYCTEDVKPKVEEVDANQPNQFWDVEHSYSHPPIHEFLSIETKEKTLEHIKQEDNPLIHGLDESYSEINDDSNKKEPLYYRRTLVYTTKDSSTGRNKISSPSVGSKIIGTKRKSQPSLLRKMFTTKMSGKAAHTSNSPDADMQQCSNDSGVKRKGGKFFIFLPRNHFNVTKFKTLGEALPYLFKRLPLVTDLAKNSSYISLYPFTASSLPEYCSWNIAKQSSSEWSRAKMIKNIIDKEEIYGSKKWNTKAVMIYGRSHGYTPKTNFKLIGKNTNEINLINSCFETPSNFSLHPQIHNVEPLVDIENETESFSEKRRRLTPVDVSDARQSSECAFIRQEALEVGVVLKNEIIDDDIIFNGSERMILESVKCLINHLVRRSLHHAVTSGSHDGQIAEIDTTRVRRALGERKELNAIHEFKMKQTKLKYFFH